MSRHLKACGTVGGYGRHQWRGEPVCEPCQIAWRNYHRARRAAGYTQPETPHDLAPCGTYAAAQRHKAHGEPPCDPCVDAARAYQAEKARGYRAAAREKRQLLDQLLADAWAEVTG